MPRLCRSFTVAARHRAPGSGSSGPGALPRVIQSSFAALPASVVSGPGDCPQRRSLSCGLPMPAYHGPGPTPIYRGDCSPDARVQVRVRCGGRPLARIGRGTSLGTDRPVHQVGGVWLSERPAGPRPVNRGLILAMFAWQVSKRCQEGRGHSCGWPAPPC